MKNRIILMMVTVVLLANLCGCESKQKNEDKTSNKKVAVKEEFDGNITESPTAKEESDDSVTESPAETIKPVEKLDITWLESGIVPQESVKVELELNGENSKTGHGYYTSNETVIPALIYVSREQGYGFGKERYGFIDENGKKLFQSTYDYIGRYTDNGLMCAGVHYCENEYLMKFGYIDQDGEEKIPFEYDFADDFHEGMAKVGKWNDAGIMKYGYINQNGEEVIPCEYDKAENFCYGFASVAKYKKVLYDGEKYKELRYGFIDKTGKKVIPLKHNSITNFFQTAFSENPIAIVGGKYIDTTGKVVHPPKSNVAYFQPEVGLMRAYDNEKVGYIDAEGKEVIPFLPMEKYDYGSFSEGLVAKVKKEGNSQRDWKVVEFLDQKGNVMITLNGWHSAGSDLKYVNGLVRLLKKKKGDREKLGFLDKTGKVVIPAKYDTADDFNDVVTRVGRDTSSMKYGAIDRNGEIVIPIQYDEMTSFTTGLSVVGQWNGNDEGMKYGVFDRNGKMLIEMECDEIHIINQGRYGYVRKGGEYGLFTNPYYEES